MTNDGWGKEWPNLGGKPNAWPKFIKIIEPTTAQAIDKAEEFITKLGKYNNLHPTHDPYTNPNATIYYQCNCGKILDPGTKSFAALNNCASEKGWKVRWGSETYIPYCVECGKDVE